jgi:hypothetical protein
MLVTPSTSTRTVRPATAVTNHMKVRRREKAGRSTRIALHQIRHRGMRLCRFSGSKPSVPRSSGLQSSCTEVAGGMGLFLDQAHQKEF